MTGQFDAVIHIDRTMALIPFERTSAWEAGEVPETYHSRCEALGFFLRPAAVWKASSQEALSILKGSSRVGIVFIEGPTTI